MVKLYSLCRKLSRKLFIWALTCSFGQSIIVLIIWLALWVGKDESNLVLWLATRAGKMELPCPLGTAAMSCKKNFPESHIRNLVLTKLIRSRWLDFGHVLFCVSINNFQLSSRSKYTQKKSQCPAISTSHLVNNSFMISFFTTSAVIGQFIRPYSPVRHTKI